MKEELIGNGKDERSIITPFLVGGVIGATVALLLAPKSGKELRADIKGMTTNARDRVTGAIDSGKNIYSEGKNAIKSAVDAGKQAFVEEREKHLKAV